MNMYITEIKKEGDLDAAAANFATLCGTNALVLGLSPANITEITNAATNFHTQFNAAAAAKANAKSIVEGKDIQKRTTKSVIAKWAKVFRANQAVPDTLLEALMLPTHNPPKVVTPPTKPTDLSATIDGTGDMTLRWNRAGNIKGTQFIIEYQTSAGGAWTMLDTVTSASYKTNWGPGQYIAFRIKAKRKGTTSGASLPLVLWNGTSGLQLQVAA
jgi:hypothetical protein